MVSHLEPHMHAPQPHFSWNFFKANFFIIVIKQMLLGASKELYLQLLLVFLGTGVSIISMWYSVFGANI